MYFLFTLQLSDLTASDSSQELTASYSSQDLTPSDSSLHYAFGHSYGHESHPYGHGSGYTHSYHHQVSDFISQNKTTHFLFYNFRWILKRLFPAKVSHSVIHSRFEAFIRSKLHILYIRSSKLHIGEYSQSGALVSASSTRSSVAGRQTEGLTRQLMLLLIWHT